MWFVEMPLPLLSFIPGVPRVAASLGIIALMIGIQLTGNFGYFNLITSIACIPLLHHAGSVFQLRWEHIVASPTTAAFHVFALAYLVPTSCVTFLFNSWINLAWFHWPVVQRMRPQFFFNHFVAVVRALAPYRLVHAFGVFPPNTPAPQRVVVQYEVSYDGGQTWQAITTRYMGHALKRFAPYHPRIDHGLFYQAFGMNGSSFTGNLGHHTPFGWTAAHSTLPTARQPRACLALLA
ncbi:hypothetical protein EON68_00445 [archaeon]|nr:MAG: hypothetical protein EON68_00445 [archaeon]